MADLGRAGVPGSHWHFMGYVTQSLHQPYETAMFLSLVYSCGNWGVKWLGDIPKDTHLRDRAEPRQSDSRAPLLNYPNQNILLPRTAHFTISQTVKRLCDTFQWQWLTLLVQVFVSLVKLLPRSHSVIETGANKNDLPLLFFSPKSISKLNLTFCICPSICAIFCDCCWKPVK